MYYVEVCKNFYPVAYSLVLDCIPLEIRCIWNVQILKIWTFQMHWISRIFSNCYREFNIVINIYAGIFYSELHYELLRQWNYSYLQFDYPYPDIVL